MRGCCLLKKITKISYPILILFVISFKSYALSPEEHLADETKEQRARSLFLEVRCLVCEGQVVESSDTEFSFEMRKLIRKKISEGKSDDEIRNDLVKEFGDDILISEIHGKNKLFLFALPALFALILLIVNNRIFLKK